MSRLREEYPHKFIPTPTTLEDREVWCAAVHGVCCKESDTTRLNQSHCIVVTFDTIYLYLQISCLLICFLASCLVSAPQDVIVIGYWCSSCYFLCVILSAFMCIYMKSLQGLHWRKNYSSSVLKLKRLRHRDVKDSAQCLIAGEWTCEDKEPDRSPMAQRVRIHCNKGDTGDLGLIPASGRFPGGGSGNPLQYSFLFFYFYFY